MLFLCHKVEKGGRATGLVNQGSPAGDTSTQSVIRTRVALLGDEATP